MTVRQVTAVIKREFFTELQVIWNLTEENRFFKTYP